MFYYSYDLLIILNNKEENFYDEIYLLILIYIKINYIINNTFFNYFIDIIIFENQFNDKK